MIISDSAAMYITVGVVVRSQWWYEIYDYSYLNDSVYNFYGTPECVPSYKVTPKSDKLCNIQGKIKNIFAWNEAKRPPFPSFKTHTQDTRKSGEYVIYISIYETHINKTKPLIKLQNIQ